MKHFSFRAYLQESYSTYSLGSPKQRKITLGITFKSLSYRIYAGDVKLFISVNFNNYEKKHICKQYACHTSVSSNQTGPNSLKQLYVMIAYMDMQKKTYTSQNSP